jgi:hypothetical protein
MMTLQNRFRKIAQDYIQDNKDILTLPEDAGKEPNVTVEEPTNQIPSGPDNSQGGEDQVQFPQTDWNFFTESDPATTNEDATALIEHLASLKVTMDVLEKAADAIRQNQQPETTQDEPADEGSNDYSVGVAPTESAPVSEAAPLTEPPKV